jgi:hypothetical protein
MPSIFAALLLTGLPSRLRLEMLELLDRREEMELDGNSEDPDGDVGVDGGEAEIGDAHRYGS